MSDAREAHVKPSVEDVAKALNAPVGFRWSDNPEGYRAHQARAVLALLPGRTETEVKAEALREAAQDARLCWTGTTNLRDQYDPELAGALDEARRALADLRGQIAALADTKPGATGRALRTLLAGSGEQPGEPRGDEQWSAAAWAAPVVPDSTDVRERLAQTFHADDCADDECDGGDMGHYDRLADIALDVVGQGVTAESEVAQVNRLLGVSLWDVPSFRADVRIDFHEDGSIYGATLLNRAVVRPTGQEEEA